MKLSTLFIGTLLLLGTAAVPLGADSGKCGVGKSGTAVEKPVKKCGASSKVPATKCGGEKSTVPAKCGNGTSSSPAKFGGDKKAPSSAKCGVGKCG